MRQIVNINQPSGSNHEGIMKTSEELKQESRFLVCLARNTALNCQYSSSGREIIYTEWIIILSGLKWVKHCSNCTAM